jgi:hypothetical protein
MEVSAKNIGEDLSSLGEVLEFWWFCANSGLDDKQCNLLFIHAALRPP